MKLTKIHALVMGAPQGTLPLYQIMRHLKRAFKPYPWIQIRQKNQPIPEFTQNALSVTGYFEPDYHGRSFCVVTVTNFSGAPKVLFEGKMRERVLFDIFATIAHERIHLLQSRKAKACPRHYRVHEVDTETKRRLQYYGSTNEIDAYGFTAALEEHCGFHSDILERYRIVFKSDDPRFKRFLKKKWQYSLTLPAICDINRL